METRVNQLFAQALELAPEDRDAFLAEECSTDAQLHLEVKRLLVDANRADEFFGGEDGNTFGAEEFKDRYSEQEGDEIGPYLLRRLLGEGGFGSVWLAEQKVPISRMVALKVVKAGMDTRQVLARFEAERQALAMMDHPNIAMVLDAGATRAGRPYFAMELVHGVRITRFCDQAEMSTRQRLELFRDVCAALNHAHQKGIIHRDIKPSNVMINPEAEKPLVKVIDFGIAKATRGKLSEATMITRMEQFVGTPVYMSPEQAAMDGADVDTRSDIYSLGILLYELLTGSPPFDAKTLVSGGYDEMRRILREVEPARPSSRIGTLTVEWKRRPEGGDSPAPSWAGRLIEPDLDWIVMKAIDKDRDRRYETANAFSQDIARFLADQPVVARPPSASYQFQKFARRHRTALRVAGGIAALLIAATLVSSWLAVRAIRAERASSATLQELRAAAPAFVIQARDFAARENFDGGIEKLDYALKLQPGNVDFLLAKADLLQCQLELEKAIPVYRAAVRANPGSTRARESLDLCVKLLAEPRDAGGKLSRESLTKLHLAMLHDQRPAAEIIPVARLLGKEKDVLAEYWLTRLGELSISPENPLENRLKFREDGLLALDLSNSKIVDLVPLEGMKLGSLNLSGCNRIQDFSPLHGFHDLKELDLSYTNIEDLAPLAGLQLEELGLGSTRITDLSALRQMKLRRLDLRTSAVDDLSALAGMPLTYLDAGDVPAKDFSPLAGAPLKTCLFPFTQVKDLSFLRNAPIEEMDLSGCLDAEGYGVFNETKSLKKLVLPENFRTLPYTDLIAISALRSHPALVSIQTDWQHGAVKLDSPGAKKDFWQSWDREVAFANALTLSGVSVKVVAMPGGGLRVTIRDQPFEDLSLLRNAPIRALTISGTQVTNLQGLETLPLEELDIRETRISDLTPLKSPVLAASLRSLYCWRTAVTDFSPLASCKNLELLDAAETALSDLSVLRGLKLKVLLLAGNAVSDISALADMPLQRVSLCRTEILDLSPLLKIPTLTEAIIPPRAKDISSLRDLPDLLRLSFTETDGGFPSQSAADFWLEFDHNSISPANLQKIRDQADARPEDSIFWLKLAGIQVWFSAIAEHSKTCTLMIERAETSGRGEDKERAAKAWCLLPSQNPDLLGRALMMARDVAEAQLNREQRPWNFQTLGMAEFRVGDDVAAQTAFLEAEEAAETDDWHPDLRPYVQVPSRFFRAMILQRSGKTAEALQLFTQTEAEMPDLPADSEVELPLDVSQNPLLCWLAHREAKAALGL